MRKFYFEKIGSKLIFTNEERGNAWFDLKDGLFYVNGRVNKDFRRFFGGSSNDEIIEEISEQNKAFGKLLEKVRETLPKISTNIGKTLMEFKDKYLHTEKFYQLDIYVSLDRCWGEKSDISFKKIPRRALPLFSTISKRRSISVSEIFKLYDKNEEQLVNKCLIYILDNINNFSDSNISTISKTRWDSGIFGELMYIIKRHNLEYKRAIDYANYVITYENMGEKFYGDWNDYLICHEKISSVQDHKYSKYPKYLKSNHDIAAQMVNLLKIENFKLFYKPELEYHDDRKYIMVAPKESDELAKEGAKLHHCVKSFIDRVNEGKTNVLFLRDKELPEDSLVTVEITNDNRIVQVEGLMRRGPSILESKFLKNYAEVKGLTLARKF